MAAHSLAITVAGDLPVFAVPWRVFHGVVGKTCKAQAPGSSCNRLLQGHIKALDLDIHAYSCMEVALLVAGSAGRTSTWLIRAVCAQEETLRLCNAPLFEGPQLFRVSVP